MNLYLIVANRLDHDSYDSAVVCAKTAKDAKIIHPNGTHFFNGKKWDDCSLNLSSTADYSWAKTPEFVYCELIGKAHKRLRRGVICSSFNAG